MSPPRSVNLLLILMTFVAVLLAVDASILSRIDGSSAIYVQPQPRSRRPDAPQLRPPPAPIKSGLKVISKGVLQGSKALPQRLSVNRNFGYSLWLQPRDIPFRLATDAATSYEAAELVIILQAMSQLSSELGQCISFRLYDPLRDLGRDHLYLSKTLNDGLATATCFSFPGRVLRSRGRGQKLILRGGVFGCLDSVRQAAKYLVNVLGLRNEYNRPDRERWITTHPQNIRPELVALELLRPYHERNVETLGTALDLESITMLDVDRYAVPGIRLLSSLSGQPIGTSRTGLLSYWDCIGITTMYSTLGCSPTVCSGLAPVSSTTSTTPASTASPVTDTSPTSATSETSPTTSGTIETSPTTSGSTGTTFESSDPTSTDTTTETTSGSTDTTSGSTDTTSGSTETTSGSTGTTSDSTSTDTTTPGSTEPTSTDTTTLPTTTDTTPTTSDTTTATTSGSPTPMVPPEPTPPIGEPGRFPLLTFPHGIRPQLPLDTLDTDRNDLHLLHGPGKSLDSEVDTPAHFPDTPFLVPVNASAPEGGEPGSGGNATAINWINVVGITNEDLSNWLSLLAPAKPTTSNSTQTR
ncbi:mucin-5AC-like [Paramacrobiotus metropolitanus]|uniref:mucin-5AC-like n=1 Tax=Paramacrobiotus metropolitanus TaxID=2943436 RepID=UPI0024463B5F|nr:mucin-5AC-like [Paramacrobiotus metropolitanus]